MPIQWFHSQRFGTYACGDILVINKFGYATMA